MGKHQRQRRKGKQLQDSSGLRGMFSGHAESGFNLLLPDIYIFLELAGQKFAHLRIKPIYVGGQGKYGEQQQDQNELKNGHGWPARFLRAIARVPTLRAVLLPLICPREGGWAVERAIRVAGRRKRRRNCSSLSAISPASVSWSYPARCSRPCNISIFNSATTGWPNRCA